MNQGDAGGTNISPWYHYSPFSNHFQKFTHKSVGTANNPLVGPKPPEHGGLYTGRSLSVMTCNSRTMEPL